MSSCHSLPPPSAAPCLVYTSCPPSQLWPLSATAFFPHNWQFFQQHRATGSTLVLTSLTSELKSSPVSLTFKCALIQLQPIQSAIRSNH